jgi:hypothetical protein
MAEGTMNTDAQSYFRRHGLAMLLSAVVSSALTVLAVFAVQRYQSSDGGGSAKKRLEELLPGRWELFEPDEGPDREWIEFRPDGTLRSRSFGTIRADGKLVSKGEQLTTIAYQVDDGEHITLNPERNDYGKRQARVVLAGDELTLQDPGQGPVKRYRRAQTAP